MQQPTFPFLLNPYLYQTAYDPHYAQAYMRSPLVTAPDGYATCNLPASSNVGIHNSLPPSSQQSAAWYRPGNCRCTYKGCAFTASQKALEVHMMDRHLVYPHGWEKRPRKSGWDADPTLKGKSIIIQGTNLTLDNPDDLKKWLAERKNRWPTGARVEEKKRKLEEAVASGHLLAGDSSLKRRKRQPSDDHRRQRDGHGIGRARATDSVWDGRRQSARARSSERPKAFEHALANSPITLVPSTKGNDDDDDDDRDDVPEVLPSKPIQRKLVERDDLPIRKHEKKAPIVKLRAGPLPKKQPHNPFAARPTLLRNLLLPDIRTTISNLSQAVRFLVDNDFLQDVEEKPGGVDRKRIQVIKSSEEGKCSTEANRIVMQK